MHKIKKGQRFGNLVIVSEDEKIWRSGRWVRVFKCKCDCGNKSIVRLPSLLKGHTASCGCLRIRNLLKMFSFWQKIKILFQ